MSTEPLLRLWPDVRHALRVLRKSPNFTAVAIVTLALGVGANTAIFAVVNALLLRPLPYHEPGKLVMVTSFDRAEQVGCLTYPRYTLMASERGAFAGLAAYAGDTVNRTESGNAEQVQVGRVSWNFFDVLGVTPAVGRRFVRSDEAATQAVMISDAFWRRELRGRSDVVGRTITLDGHPWTIVGVLPPLFSFGLVGSRVEIWLPRIDQLSLATPEQLRGGTCYLNAVGRLTPDADISRAQIQMDVLNGRYSREYAGLPDADPRRRVRVQPLREALVAGSGRILLTLVSAVAVVLLVACANVAGLLLARSSTRQREMAMRAALGATRPALVRQLLTESLVLAIIGGSAGVALSFWAARGLGATLAGVLPRPEGLAAGVDLRVLAFAAGLSLVTGIVFGLSPAIHCSKADLLALSKGDGGGSGRAVHPIVARRMIVIAQVAVTVVLVICAGLLARTFWRLQRLDPGFDPTGVVAMNLSLPRAGYPTSAQMITFYQELLEKVRATGSVRSAALASALPVNPSRASPVLVEGQPAVPLAERPIVTIQMVLGPYFDTMKIRLVRGRVFDERDVAASSPVVAVNEAFVRRFFQGSAPIGRHVTLGRRTTPAEIVGVVGDVRNQALASDPVPEIEVPFTQLAWASMNLLVLARGDAASAVGSVRAAIASLDGNLPVTGVTTLDDVLSAGRAKPKVVMTLLSLFAVTALVLAMIGVYGLVAYSVGQRQHELAVRLALGARHADLVRRIVREGLVLATLGAGAGVAAAFAATHLLASLLYEVATTDTLSFCAGPAVLLALAPLASWIPALRIVRLDPSVALRSQ